MEAAVALGLLDAILITEEDKSTEPYARELFNLISRVSRDLQADNSGVFGLVGENLSYSFSKDIHEALGRYKFNLYSLSRNEMVDFIEKRQFDGLTVTIPYKQEVFPLCDEVSNLAQEIGAINLIYLDRLANGERKLIGHNTDYEGFLFT